MPTSISSFFLRYLFFLRGNLGIVQMFETIPIGFNPFARSRLVHFSSLFLPSFSFFTHPFNDFLFSTLILSLSLNLRLLFNLTFPLKFFQFSYHCQPATNSIECWTRMNWGIRYCLYLLINKISPMLWVLQQWQTNLGCTVWDTDNGTFKHVVQQLVMAYTKVLTGSLLLYKRENKIYHES